MLGTLPTTLQVNSIDRAIRSDYRVALIILSSYSNVNLSDSEKVEILLSRLYEDINEIPIDDMQEAVIRAIRYLDGKLTDDMKAGNLPSKPVMDWEQDEQMIFSAVNKVAGGETRALPYLHWWTFLGYFNEISDGLLSSVINIRRKLNKRVSLEKHETEFYRSNKSLIDLQNRYTAEEQAQLDYFKELIGQ